MGRRMTGSKPSRLTTLDRTDRLVAHRGEKEANPDAGSGFASLGRYRQVKPGR